MDRSNHKRRLGELDALRGFAALMVVTFHFTLFEHIDTSKSLLRFGVTGVDLFFMISGFVIFMSISTVGKGREFIIHRFARLYPVYWVCLSFSFLLHLYDQHFLLHQPVSRGLVVQYAVNFSMLQYYFNIPNLEDPYWSLIVELVFYVVIYAIYKLKQLHRIEPILFSLVLVQLGISVFELLYPGNAIIKGIIVYEHFFPLSQYLSLFLTGIIFYKILQHKGAFFRYFMIAVCYAEQVLEYPHRIALSIFNTAQWQYAVILAIFILLFALFVNNMLRFIVAKITLFLGRISYALYLFHQYLILSFLLPVFITRLHFSFVAGCIFSLIVTVGVAALITIYIDEPLRFRVRRALQRKFSSVTNT